MPIPILRGDLQLIKALRTKLYQPELSALTVVGFSDIAQSCNTYDAFTSKLAETPEPELNYFGIVICGEKNWYTR